MNFNILVPITFLASLFGIVYILVTARHRERLSMIKNGVQAKDLFNKEKARANTLKAGMLLIGFGVGILIGHYVDSFIEEVNSLVFHIAFMFLFGGLALLLNYNIEKKRKNE